MALLSMHTQLREKKHTKEELGQGSRLCSGADSIERKSKALLKSLKIEGHG